MENTQRNFVQDAGAEKIKALFRVFGTPGKPPLLIIHGFPGNAGDWHEVAGKLSSDFMVILPDLMGFGAAADVGLSFELLNMHAQADRLVNLVNHMNLGNFFVVGHDYGVPVAILVAERLQHKVSKLVLSAGNFSTAPPLNPLMRALAYAPLFRVAAALLFSKPSLQWMRVAGTKKGNRYPTENNKAEREAIKTIFATSLRQVTKYFADVEAKSVSLGMKTLLIWGGKDPFFSISFANELTSKIPDAHLRVFEAAGHYVYLEEPNKFIEEVTNFFLT